MPRKSSIDRLPKELRQKIADLRDAGWTIDDILGKLGEFDVDVSRSALGRHVQKLDKLTAHLRESRAVAEALVKRFGDEPDSQTARANVELMQSVVMRLLASEDGELVTLQPGQAKDVATALEKLAKAEAFDTARIIKIEERARAKAIQDTVDAAIAAARKAAKEAGVTLGKEALAQIRRELGVA